MLWVKYLAFLLLHLEFQSIQLKILYYFIMDAINEFQINIVTENAHRKELFRNQWNSLW